MRRYLVKKERNEGKNVLHKTSNQCLCLNYTSQWTKLIAYARKIAYIYIYKKMMRTTRIIV